MKFFIVTLLTTLAMSNGQKAAGSIVRFKMTASGSTDQIRVLTQPRPGFDPVADKPSIFTLDGGGCDDSSHNDFIFESVDDNTKCCFQEHLNGFKMWEEKQNYMVEDDILAQDIFEPNAECFERKTKDYGDHVIPYGEYNVYMIQGMSFSKEKLVMNNLFEFHNQDVIAMIYNTDKMHDSDQYFALGSVDTYSSVRSNKFRGYEPSKKEGFLLNCEARPSLEDCETEAPQFPPGTNGNGNTAGEDDEDETEPGDAGTNGDPHFKSWKGEHFEYHGQCDLVLAKDHEFADGIGMEVQIRTKLVRFWSYIKRVAIRIGDDILEIEGSPDLDDRETHYWFNLQYKKSASSIGGFPMSITSNGVQKRFVEIDLSSRFPGQKILISTFREFVRVDFRGGTAESFGNTVGMMGAFETGELLARDGVTKIHDFMEFGNEWQLLPADDMLFHDKSEPQFPKRCIVPEDPQGQRRRRLDESSISVEAAEAACGKVLGDTLDIKDCVYDILATQDLDMVGAF